MVMGEGGRPRLLVTDSMHEKARDGETLWRVQRGKNRTIDIYVSPDWTMGCDSADRLAEAIAHYVKEVRGV